MKRIFVDMDGCIAKWDNFNKTYEEFTTPGFYENLGEQYNLIEAIKIVDDQYDNIYYLSHYIKKRKYYRYYCKEEKLAWLKKVFPNVKDSHIYLIPITTPKDRIFKNLTKDDILIDDYNKNLYSWEAAGGTGIKFVNRHNDTHKSWPGERIYYNYSIKKIVDILSA